MSKADIWMPLYIGDYLADTMHLNAEQNGVYLLLIMHYWRTGPLPNNDDLLRQVAKCPEHSWANTWGIVKQFFKLENNHWVQHRIDDERKKAQDIKNAAVAKGVAGAAARWGKNTSSNASSISSGNAQAMVDQCTLQSPSPSPLQSPPPLPSQTPKKKNGALSAPPKKVNGSGKTSDLWSAYSEAYRCRYGVDPVRNAKVNGQLSHFIERIGLSEAPFVAAYYVTSNNSWYVKKGHSVDDLLKDAEKLRTEWITRRQVTARAANELDRKSKDAEEWTRLIQQIEREGNGQNH